MDTVINSTTREIMYVGSDNAANGYLRFNVNTGGDMTFALFNTSNTLIRQIVVPLGYLFDGSVVRIACSVDWDNQDMICSVNGQSVSDSIPTNHPFDMSVVNFGDSNGGGAMNSRIHYGRFVYHPDVLTATQLDALTL